jgi:hypothetical protein
MTCFLGCGILDLILLGESARVFERPLAWGSEWISSAWR